MYFIEKLTIADTYFSGIYNTLDIFWVEHLVLKQSREKSHNVPPFNDNTNFKNNSTISTRMKSLKSQYHAIREINSNWKI